VKSSGRTKPKTPLALKFSHNCYVSAGHTARHFDSIWVFRFLLRCVLIYIMLILDFNDKGYPD
jgi:hypothetical protein